MAFKPEYVVRETATNLSRNLTLTIASIITIFVALVLFGSADMFRKGTENGTQQFKDGVEFIVFLDPAITGEQLDSISAELRGHPDIDDIEFIDKQQAYDQFLEWYGDETEFRDAVTPEIMPPSYEVKPRQADPLLVESLADQFRGRAGVFSVETAQETTETIVGIADAAQRWMLWGSLAALVGGALLIFNTVRVAMFARRREIEVMKLVGASNWYIRMPFVLEGLVHGLIGGLLATFAVRFLRTSLQDDVLESEAQLFQLFFVSDAEAFGTSVLVLAVGAAVGVACSAFAVGRFLDV
ncbi:MAG: permease-like cell division protein FtsX [Actinomycetota bacterium]